MKRVYSFLIHFWIFFVYRSNNCYFSVIRNIITHKVVQPGNCKQNVPVALADFYEYTLAAVTGYFLEKKNEAGFFEPFNTWWIIPNSKVQLPNHILVE